MTTYGYDVDNKLTTSSTGASLTYDPTGRLYQVTSSGGTVTRYIYDGPRLSAAYDSSGTLLRRFVHGPGVDEPVVWYEGSGTTDRRWLVADNQGSTVAVTNSSGAVTNLNTYDEYGVPGASNAGLFQYTGQIWIAEFGLYHYKARAYSPTLGRFLQTDPIGMKDDLDLYAYVGNDPTDRSDPTGLFEAPVDPKIAKQAYTIVKLFITGSRIPVAVRVAAAAPVVAAVAVPAAGGVLINTAMGSSTAKDDENSHYVVRGGTCTTELFCKASGASTDSNGKLHGVSVQSFPRTSVKELIQIRWIPNNQISVSDVQAIRQAGGVVIRDPTPGNPYHALLGGLSAEDA